MDSLGLIKWVLLGFSQLLEKMTKQKQENMWVNLGLNILLPSLLLSKGDEWLGLSASLILVIALVFPVAYGVYDFVARKKVNIFSVLGFVSVLLTGGIGLLKLDPFWVAVKEAAVPFILGVAMVLSLRTRYPLIKVLLYNDQMLDTDLIQERLESRGTENDFFMLLRKATWMLGFSLLLSAVLNYVVARWIVVTDPAVDDVMFNAELGKLMWLSWPIIVLPTGAITLYAFWSLIKGIPALTGLSFEQALAPHLREKAEQAK